MMSGYEENPDRYKFVCNQWTTGDAGRVSASNITYDTELNIIHVNAGTGRRCSRQTSASSLASR